MSMISVQDKSCTNHGIRNTKVPRPPSLEGDVARIVTCKKTTASCFELPVSDIPYRHQKHLPTATL